MRNLLFCIMATFVLMTLPAFGQVPDSTKIEQKGSDSTLVEQGVSGSAKANSEVSDPLFVYSGVKPLGENQKSLELMIENWLFLNEFKVKKVYIEFFGNMTPGGTGDFSEAEKQRFQGRVELVEQDSTWIDLFIGSADSLTWTGWKGSPRKVDYQNDESVGSSRRSWGWFDVVVKKLRAFVLELTLHKDRRGIYWVRLKVEPRQLRTITNNYVIDKTVTRVIGDTTGNRGSGEERGIFSPISLSLGATAFRGDVRVTEPTASIRLKIVGDFFFQYSFSYWQKNSSDFFGNRVFVANQGMFLYIPWSFVGVIAGAQNLEERVKSKNEFLRQESGLFFGLMLRLEFSRSVALEAFGNFHLNNLNQFGVDETKSSRPFSVGAQLTFTPSL